MDELHEDPTMLVRTFSAELSAGDGRTADVRIVPYGVRAKCDDGLGGVPRGVVYEEEWAPGAFSHQVNAAHRVVANIEHERGVAGMIGKGLALREGKDGFYGSFKFLDTPNGNTALELVREGTFDSVSLEARPVRNERGSDGVIKRIKANLVGIAFCRTPAFAGAAVLGLREGLEEDQQFTWDEALMLPAPDPEVMARMAALGLKVPASFVPVDDAPADDEQ